MSTVKRVNKMGNRIPCLLPGPDIFCFWKSMDN